jgi:sigma-B regulation protein RsbU (phosphoserine phosphatase)
LNLAWMPWIFAGSAGLTAAFLLLGLIGLGRPYSVEAHRLQPPAFIRRIEEERRLRYEMQLLARMQEGLLPQSVPDLPGWEIAARSILATEAGGDLYDFLFDDDGRLWVAVGDVAGHGYSCAIVQAMTTAALTSLIRPGALPSEILVQVDRVIRRGGSSRNFASLALLRLDPATGEVVIANAGHPFPLLILDGDVSELVLPGLPLGKGPRRIYLDTTLHLPPGAALVFCSDGLMETQDWQENPYGFERPLEVLRRTPSAPAESLLEILLADWRRHLGTEEPPDDTTVVVVRRAG